MDWRVKGEGYCWGGCVTLYVWKWRYTSFSCVHYSLNTVSPHKTVAEFIDLCLGDVVNSGIGLSYWPASLCSLAGRYDNPRSTKTTFHSHFFSIVCSIWPAAAGEPVWRGGSGRPPAEPPVPTGGGGGHPHPRAALRAAQLPSRPLRPSRPWLQLPDHQWTVRQYWLVNNIDFVPSFVEQI